MSGVQHACVFVARSDQAVGAKVLLVLPPGAFTHVSVETADGQTLRYALAFKDHLERHEGVRGSRLPRREHRVACGLSATGTPRKDAPTP